MGFMRKALFVSTGGLSGVAVKANSKKERAAKAAEKQVKLQRQMLKTQQAQAAAAAQAAQATVVATAVPVTDELERLASLHASGALSNEEFAAAKAKLLSS